MVGQPAHEHDGRFAAEIGLDTKGGKSKVKRLNHGLSRPSMASEAPGLLPIGEHGEHGEKNKTVVRIMGYIVVVRTSFLLRS